MKRIGTLCLAALLLLGMAACGQSGTPEETGGYDADTLTAAARTAEAQLRGGEYAALYETFDAEMKAAITEDALKSSWEATAATLGAYVGEDAVTTSEADGYFVVDLVVRYEKRSLNVHVVFDQEGRIAGLRNTYVDLPAETGLWSEVEVTVSGDPSMPLPGLLTLPQGVEKPPVVILVHGSGASNKNEVIGAAGNAPFADLAHGLAEQGVATLRYDKRTYAYPTAFSDLAAVTLEAEVLDDVSAAIALMQGDERVDGARVFVLGHSLGGMLTPRIAADHPDLAGVLSMAGSLRQLWDISYDQNMEAVANLGELPDDQKALLDQQLEQLEKDHAALSDGSYAAQDNSATLMGIPVGYWKSLDASNGMKFIQEVAMPMFVFQGDADFQVYPDKDYPLWVETTAGMDNVTCKLYEGLNHLMMPTTGLRTVADYDTENHVAQAVIDDIAAFVKSNG